MVLRDSKIVYCVGVTDIFIEEIGDYYTGVVFFRIIVRSFNACFAMCPIHIRWLNTQKKNFLGYAFKFG